MNNNQRTEEITSYMEDAKYSVTEKPYINIYKVIGIWVISIFISDFILNTLTYKSIQYDWIMTNWYFPLYNLLEVIFYTITIIIYFIALNKVNPRYREKKFLKMWSCIPIVIVFSKMIPLFIQYINAIFLLNYFNVLPIHSIAFLIGILLIYSYRRNKIYLIEVIINSIILLLDFFLTVSSVNSTIQMTDLSIHIIIFLSNIDLYNIYMLLLLLFMYLDYRHDQKLS